MTICTSTPQMWAQGLKRDMTPRKNHDHMRHEVLIMDMLCGDVPAAVFQRLIQHTHIRTNTLNMNPNQPKENLPLVLS